MPAFLQVLPFALDGRKPGPDDLLATPVSGEEPFAPLADFVKKEEIGVITLGRSSVVNEVRSFASPRAVAPGSWMMLPWLE